MPPLEARTSTASDVLRSLRDLRQTQLDAVIPPQPDAAPLTSRTPEGKANLAEALRARRFLETSGLLLTLFELNQDILRNKGRVTHPQVSFGKDCHDGGRAKAWTRLTWKTNAEKRPYYELTLSAGRNIRPLSHRDTPRGSNDKVINMELETRDEPDKIDPFEYIPLEAVYELSPDFNFGRQPSEEDRLQYRSWFAQNVARFIERVHRNDEFWRVENPLFLPGGTEWPDPLSVRYSPEVQQTQGS